MILSNERGIITVDYLFAMVLVMGFSFIIFALSLTLTMVEVVQYVTYSSARNYFAAGMDPQDQAQRAYFKFQGLRNSETLGPLFESGWFELNQVSIYDDIPSKVSALSGYQQDEPRKNLFQGTVVYFTSKVLDFSIPFYGGTADDELRGQQEFGAWIGSYLGREVTQLECENFFIYRPQFILKLSTGGNAPYTQATDFNTELVSPDNGC